ncbi:MAG: hypothetical protein WA094_04665 [Candidatus Desulfobacillus denitrificans]
MGAIGHRQLCEAHQQERGDRGVGHVHFRRRMAVARSIAGDIHTVLHAGFAAVPDWRQRPVGGNTAFAAGVIRHANCGCLPACTASAKTPMALSSRGLSRLRCAALEANVVFVAYGFPAPLGPLAAPHVVPAPINGGTLWQARPLVKPHVANSAMKALVDAVRSNQPLPASRRSQARNALTGGPWTCRAG